MHFSAAQRHAIHTWMLTARAVRTPPVRISSIPPQGFAWSTVFRHRPAPHPGRHTPRASSPHRNTQHTHGCATCRTHNSRPPEPATTLLTSCSTADKLHALPHRDTQPRSTYRAHISRLPIHPHQGLAISTVSRLSSSHPSTPLQGPLSS